MIEASGYITQTLEITGEMAGTSVGFQGTRETGKQRGEQPHQEVSGFAEYRTITRDHRDATDQAS